MTDRKKDAGFASAGSCGSAAAVTPNNSADLDYTTRYLYVGGAGTLKVDMEDGTAVTFPAIAAGALLPIRCKRVYATGTSATNIAALF